jgi:hypothetical protein
MAMAMRSAKKPTRQVKALGTLVLSMTLGTALLNWVHGLTPARSTATPLRSIGNRPTWDRIVVETVPARGLRADGTIRAFHHLSIDRDGRLAESAAWLNESPDPHTPGAIRIAVHVDQAGDLSPRQWKRLAATVAHLQSIHDIPSDRVGVEGARAGSNSAGRDRLDTMLRTR